jgi:hypothetical protein
MMTIFDDPKQTIRRLKGRARRAATLLLSSEISGFMRSSNLAIMYRSSRLSTAVYRRNIKASLNAPRTDFWGPFRRSAVTRHWGNTNFYQAKMPISPKPSNSATERFETRHVDDF